MQASVISQHFWLFCGLWVGFGGFLFGKFRSRKFIAQGIMTPQESNSLLVGYLASILVPCLLFWILSLSMGSPNSPDFLSWTNPQQTLAVMLLFSCWGLLLYWVFLRAGSTRLVKLFMLISNLPQSWLRPPLIKGFIVFVVGVGVLSFLSPGI